jgi:hypothetical protein
VDFSTLRRRCQQRLRDLSIPQPFDLELLCADVAATRGRPIRLLPMTLPGSGPCGLWLAGEQADYIVYQEATSRLHQEHIVLHEIGHLLCRHRVSSVTDGHLDAVFPHLNPETVRKILARSRYATEEEREAELIATLILQRAQRAPRTPRALDPASAAILARLEASIDPSGRRHDG